MLNMNGLAPRAQIETGTGTLLAKERGVVFSVIRLFPSPRQRAELVEILRSVQDLTRPLPGCMGCWLSEQDYLHNHVRYAEQWESEEALHEHIRSDLYSRVLAAMELSKKAPEVQFYFSTEAKGFELIESIRRKDVTRLASPNQT
jgi:quinol monooxygenase YgiN